MEFTDDMEISSFVQLVHPYDRNPFHRRALAMNKGPLVFNGSKRSQTDLDLMLFFCKCFEGN